MNEHGKSLITCPICGNQVKLSLDGTLRGHVIKRGVRCEGTWCTPNQAYALAGKKNGSHKS